eukprot:SAG31_NODE_5235_length_2658_cov_7.828449_2_plen_102_part_00
MQSQGILATTAHLINLSLSRNSVANAGSARSTGGDARWHSTSARRRQVVATQYRLVQGMVVFSLALRSLFGHIGNDPPSNPPWLWVGVLVARARLAFERAL